MSQVLVLSDDPRLEEGLRSAGMKVASVRPADLGHTAKDRSPGALVLDVRGQHQLPAGLSAFRKQYPGSGVVLVTSTLDPRLMLEAMRAGVTECVHEPITPPALLEAVRRVLVNAAPEQHGQLMAFVGVKGGVGTTTLAVNTGIALARASGSEVLVIDMHIGHGDAAVLLGVEPRFSVLDALENVHRVDESFFKGLVEKSKAGIDLLGSSDRILPGPIDPRRFHALLEFATRKYRYTVLDVPRSDVAMLDVLEAASTVVLVTNQEVPALRTASRLGQTLRTRYGATRVKTVVNRFDRKAEIGHADIERVTGDTVKHCIPSDYRVAVDALNAGRPVVLDQSRLADAFRVMATDLGGIQKRQPAAQAGSVLGRLALRRA
jgi:pilus assembly protein CpaE